MKKMILVLIMIVALLGCTSARVSRNLSSGAIGCPPQDIEILNETADRDGMHNFEAICKDKHFFCSYHKTAGINCKEQLK